MVFATALSPHYSKDAVLASMQLLRAPREPAAATTTLRVGYLPDSLPFAFTNHRGDLVGFDVELAHQLARDLEAALTFVPIDREQMARQLADGDCDIVMSGVAVTTERARDLLLTEPYLDETLAFVVPDHQRKLFADWNSIRKQASLTIAVADVPYYIRILRERLPGATIDVRDDIEALLANRDPGAMAVALPAERGSAWTLRYPAYSVVVPGPDPIKVPLAYPIGKRDEAFARLVNTWIALKRKDGTLDAAYKHWILGHDAAPVRPRWSIARDVLHWME